MDDHLLSFLIVLNDLYSVEWPLIPLFCSLQRFLQMERKIDRKVQVDQTSASSGAPLTGDARRPLSSEALETLRVGIFWKSSYQRFHTRSCHLPQPTPAQSAAARSRPANSCRPITGGGSPGPPGGGHLSRTVSQSVIGRFPELPLLESVVWTRR